MRSPSLRTLLILVVILTATLAASLTAGRALIRTNSDKSSVSKPAASDSPAGIARQKLKPIRLGVINDKPVPATDWKNAFSFSSPNATAIFAPMVTATKSAVIAPGGDLNGNGFVNPGDTLMYSVVVGNSSMDALNVVFTDTLNANLTLVGGTVAASPIAVNDSYSTLGNVCITVPVGSGLLANDINPQGTGTVAASAGATSTNGGAVSVAADGSFTYNPPAGFRGNDTFTYTLTHSNGKMDTGIVTINISGMVWFINNNAAACTTLAGGCGRLSNPFSTLAAFNGINNGSGNNPMAGDTIFIFESGTAYTGGVTLLNNQKLIGQDSTVGLAAAAGLTVPPFSNTLPATNSANGTIVTITNSGGNGISTGSGNRIQGLTVGDTTGSDINGSGFGTLIIRDTTLNGTGRALNLNNGTLDAIIASIVSNNSSATGITLTNLLANSALTVSGTTTVNNPAAATNSIVIDTVGAGSTLTFTGAVSITNRKATGIFIDNAQGTFSFGATTIANPNNAGGYGIRVEDSSAAVTFASATISATNQTTATSDAGSDGIPDSDGDGDAIFLKNTTGSFTLNGGTLSNLATDGIDCRSCRNLTVSGVTITQIGLNSGNVATVDDAGIYVFNISGTNLVQNSTISRFEGQASGGAERGINILQTNGNNFTEFRVNNTSFSNLLASGIRGDDGISYRSEGAVSGKLVVENNCSFLNISGHGIELDPGATSSSSGTFEFDLLNSTFTSQFTEGSLVQGGVEVQSQGNMTIDAEIRNSTFTGLGPANANAGVIHFAPQQNNGSLTAVIDSCTILGTIPAPGSGRTRRGAINLRTGDLAGEQLRNLSFTVNNCDINDIGDDALFLDIRGESLTGAGATPGNIKITNNRMGNVTPVGQDGLEGVTIRVRNTVGTLTKTVNLLINNNNIRNADNSTGDETIDLNAEDRSIVNATVTNNTLTSNGSAAEEFDADTTAATATMCLNITGNSLNRLNNPGGNDGRITISETAGVLNIATHNNANMVASANSIPNGNVTINGSPQFNQPVCTTPTLMAPVEAGETSQSDNTAQRPDNGGASPNMLARARQWLIPVFAAFSAPTGYVNLDWAFNRAPNLTPAVTAAELKATDKLAVNESKPAEEIHSQPVQAASKAIPTKTLIVNSRGETRIVPTAMLYSMLAGETITVPAAGNFTLPAGESTTIMFNATIGAGFTGTSVANQASVSGSNFTTIVSNNLMTEVFQPPTISKAFSPTTIPSNGNSTVTLTLTNLNATQQTNASFTDTLTNMSAVGGAVGGTCVGTTPNTLGAGATNLSFSGITIPGSGSCTVTFAVTSSTTGIHPNQTSGVTTAQTTPTAGAPSNIANLTVLDPPTISKAFAPSSIPFGGTSTVTLTLGNTNAINLTGASFTDTLTNMSAVGGAVGGTCVGTTPAMLAANATALSFSGITIPSAGNCTVTFAVKSSVIGMHNNQTSGVTTTQTPTPGLASNVAVLTVVKADTTTTITSDNPDPSVVGQVVAINYSVSVTAPGSGTPTGNVTVTASTGEMCTGTVAAGTCNITFNTVGLRTLTAAYAGDSNFNGSTSATENHTVNKADTTTAITSDNPDPSVVGQAVTINYTVTANAPGSGTPTGNVTVTASTGETCTATVAAGTCNITFNTAGARTLTAAYAGDSNFNGSTSATENHTVNKADTTTTITADTPDPSVVGQPYLVTANVTVNAPGTGTPTGTITVSDGTGGTCVINLPGTSCNLTSTTAGAKTLTATYNGDAEFNTSVSAGVPHQVNKADTTATITADTPDPSVVGQPYAVTANVAVNAPGAGTPTGTITVSDGSQTCNITLPGTSCNLTSTTAGAKTLTATYNGDANFNASPASAGVPHQVNKANTTTAITSDNPDPSVVGQTVTVNFTVTATAPGSGTPTGNVTVSDGVNSCVGTVAAGTCNLALVTAGARTLTATYAGDANYNGSASPGEPHTVNQAATTTAITNDSPDPTVVGQPYTVTFSVTVNAPGTGTPTGTVTVSDGSQTCMATLPATTCNLTSTTAGAKNLTATYSGDSNFSGSVSATAPHTVNKANTTIGSLTDSPDPSVTGQAYTVGFTLSVVSPGAGTPTGTVTVNDGTGGTCTATLPATTCSLTSTTVGAKTLTFTYNGDANFNTSSNTAGHQVNKANTTTAITSDNPDPSAVGQSVTVNFTVTAAAPGSGTPTGNVTVSDGVDSCTGTVAAGTCNITLTTPGNRTLTASYAGDANFNSSTSAGEPHLVANPPALTKIFTPSSIPVGGTSTLQFTINNTNGFAINGIAFSDTLPAGVTVTTTGPTATCGGTLTTTAPDQIAFTGGSVNANSNCQFSVTVTGTTFGAKNNTTSTITSSNAGTGTAATAQLKVIAPPGLTKAFGAPSIPLGTTTSLTFTINNPNTAGTTNTALSGISFTDTLPAGLSVASTGPTATCGGTLTTTSPNSISFSGGSLAAGASCNFSVTVTGAQAGAWTNAVNSISSTEGGTNSTPATAGIIVVAPPAIAKSFSPTTVQINGISTLTISITNPAANTVALTGVAVTDNFPAGLQVDTTPMATNSCGTGTFAPAANATSVTISGATIPVNTTCTFTVKVKGTTSGPKVNTTGAVTSANGGTGNTATATLTVGVPPTIAKAFGATDIALNGTTSLTFNINNSNSLPLTGVAFTDSLPAGLVIATPSALSTSCGGVVTANAGASSISLTGGTIAASGSCVISLNVRGTTPGPKNNTTSVITANETGPGLTSNTATVTVHPISISIADPAICLGTGGLVGVTATVTNAVNSSQPVNFTATLPAQLLALPGTCTVNTGTCNVVNAGTVNWSGTLASGQTVTIKYQAQVAETTPTGTQLCINSAAVFNGGTPVTVQACTTVNCPSVGPGILPAGNSPVSDQKGGSILIYNIYTSSATASNSQNTRINLTNTEPTRPAIVHLFLIDGSSCVVADSLLCLTPNQTTSFLTSDIDPGTTGFIIAVAVNSTGCPINFNYLVGDEYVKFSSGHEANLAAESVTAIAGGLTACNDNSVTAQINFDGVSYSPLPYVLSASSIPSRSDGNDTMLILNRIGGNLGIGVNRLDSLFGIFYDDAERGVSFSFLPGVCQFRSSINNNFPRTTPRFEQFVPPGRTGWFKLWQQNAAAMTGSLINFNPNAAASADAYNQGHNLHVLTNTTSASYIIPVFPPNC
ncbi:MAG: beta strand repeat-containing protein [Blastocatellales bacterium]